MHKDTLIDFQICISCFVIRLDAEGGSVDDAGDDNKGLNPLAMDYFPSFHRYNDIFNSIQFKYFISDSKSIFNVKQYSTYNSIRTYTLIGTYSYNIIVECDK